MFNLLVYRFLYLLRPKVFESMAETIAFHTLFQTSEIKHFYEKVRSWDMVIATCGYASIMGAGNLIYAFEKMTAHHPEASAEELYKMYGIM